MSLTEPQSFVKVALYPSGDFEVSLKGCRVRVKSDENKKSSIRGKINALSPESSKRCLTTFRAMAHLFKVEICLTYPLEMLGTMTGPDSKEHLHRFLKWVAYQYGKDLIYGWVLEFQGNGNPHFHVLVDRYIPKEEVAKSWYSIVGSGLEKHLNAGTRVSEIRSPIGMADYMARYLTKMEQKEVPSTFLDVGRFWGSKRGAVEKHEIILGYPDSDSARRATRPVRKARKASLRRFQTKKGNPIKWKWGGSGFTDRSMGLKWSLEIFDKIEGEPVDENGKYLSHDACPF